jgi:hypothetical protein
MGWAPSRALRRARYRSLGCVGIESGIQPPADRPPHVAHPAQMGTLRSAAPKAILCVRGVASEGNFLDYSQLAELGARKTGGALWRSTRRALG